MRRFVVGVLQGLPIGVFFGLLALERGFWCSAAYAFALCCVVGLLILAMDLKLWRQG
ncbi:hypothetical protein [Agaricicola taiwanensis]|uniref:hypothetical protein n=1 Tax=Agaricicola taiwanensis TaxID=591372 RepID=UPI00166C25FB|nr:hypothetical protein [Agaricicola taiwanensis]